MKMFGCMRRVVALVLLLLVVGVAFVYRDTLRRAWDAWRADDTESMVPSEAMAERAERKMQRLRDGESSQVALSSRELESLLLFRYPGVLPAFLGSPTLELVADQLKISARVPVDQIPRGEGLSDVAAFLPDTAEVMVAGRLLPLDSGRVAFAVDEVSAARVPVPQRFVPGALRRAGRRDEPGLPSDAIALPLPPGAAAAYIRRDSLVLLARPVTR